MPEGERHPHPDEVGPKEGQGIDEVEGFTAEELEQAHQDDAAREAAKEQTEE